MNSTLYKLVIIGILMCLFGKASGQFSMPSDENYVIDNLTKPLITVTNYKVSLLGYIKPEHSYHPTLGAFCVLENKIAKNINFPVKMRLGSVDYVDKLEKKRN